jgi:hypothetical protein
MTPEEFPAVFGRGWALPKPQTFLDHFLPLIHPQATFTQPMFSPTAQLRSSECSAGCSSCFLI